MVYVFCVNDGAVMTAWKKDQGLAGSEMIEFLADTDAALTEALGLVLTGDGKPYGAKEGPNNALGFHTKRCKRSAMYCVDGVLKVMQLSLIHISEPTRQAEISYAVFCLKKKI